MSLDFSKTEKIIGPLWMVVIILAIGLIMTSIKLYRLDNLVAAHQSNAEHLRESDDQADLQDNSVIEIKIYDARVDMLRQDLYNASLSYDIHKNKQEYCESLSAVVTRADEIIQTFSHLQEQPAFDPLTIGTWKYLAKNDLRELCGL